MSKNILMVVEGEKTDARLMDDLYRCIMPDNLVKIVPYCTNIYELYHELFENNEDIQDIDFVAFLRQREKDIDVKKILRQRFNEILLVFDFDPQDRLYSPEKLRCLMEFFNESTENGRLYLNYPMVESFFHISSFNEQREVFRSRKVDFNCLLAGKYKQLVSRESCQFDIKEIAVTTVKGLIIKHWEKTKYLLKSEQECGYDILKDLMDFEIISLENEKVIFVLNTSVLYFFEYNSVLAEGMDK